MKEKAIGFGLLLLVVAGVMVYDRVYYGQGSQVTDEYSCVKSYIENSDRYVVLKCSDGRIVRFTCPDNKSVFDMFQDGKRYRVTSLGDNNPRIVEAQAIE